MKMKIRKKIKRRKLASRNKLHLNCEFTVILFLTL